MITVVISQSVPGFDSWSGQFPGWYFSGVSINCKTNRLSGKLGYICPRVLSGHRLWSFIHLRKDLRYSARPSLNKVAYHNLISSRLYNSLPQTSSSECSAHGQVLHCMRRNLGYSSTEGKYSTENSGTKAGVLPGIE